MNEAWNSDKNKRLRKLYYRLVFGGLLAGLVGVVVTYITIVTSLYPTPETMLIQSVIFLSFFMLTISSVIALISLYALDLTQKKRKTP